MSPSTTATSPKRASPDACVSLLERLRTETAHQHRELEATVNITRRLVDRHAYRWLLQKFYGFYHPLELKLARSPAAERGELALPERRKGRWLADDLAQLGVADLSQLPACGDLPLLDTWPAAAGAMYVLEGSTLGGRHIATLLKGSAIPPTAQRFFHSYGADVGTKWRSFCSILDELSASVDQDTAVANARETFASMRAWLEDTR
jgi:heme oxygenase